MGNEDTVRLGTIAQDSFGFGTAPFEFASTDFPVVLGTIMPADYNTVTSVQVGPIVGDCLPGVPGLIVREQPDQDIRYEEALARAVGQSRVL
jgi:hypothetical protein